jgi:hypothetical protein
MMTYKKEAFFKLNKLFEYMPKYVRVCTETKNLDEYKVYNLLKRNP